MLPLEGSKEEKKREWKNWSSQIQSQNNQGTLRSFYSRWLEKAKPVMSIFFLLFSLPTFHNFTSKASRQPFLFTSHSPHPLPLERCKVNISIGLQWPVSTALIPTLLFEGSIVPDLLAWFACLWIMAKEPQSGLLPSTHFSLSQVWSSTYIWITVIYPYGMEPLILGHILCGLGCTVCGDSVTQTTPQPVVQHCRYSIPVYTKAMGVKFPRYPAPVLE